MNARRRLTCSLTAIGLLGLLGSAAAASQVAGSPAQAVEPTPGAAVPPAQGPWDPWDEMHRIQEGIDALFAESWARIQAATGGAQPILAEPPGDEITFKEEPNDYRITAAFPGVKESDLKVSLEGRQLRISAQREVQEEDRVDGGRVVREEDYENSIQRAFTLPGPVDASKMHSQFANGVLTVTIPKAPT
ncbi:MAG: Hsp20/alpha crystallin family protein [Bdellovibrio bacteriovorus]